jgi:enoyl-CoA hydratase
MSLADLDDSFEHVKVNPDDPVDHAVTIVFDRPEARNAMNQTLRRETRESLEAVEDSDARVIVITASSESSMFLSGADIKEMQERTQIEQRKSGQTPRIFEQVEDHPLPTIARVNGHALGGGCELALACDIRIADSSVLFGLPEITLGLLPGGGGTQRLPRLVGEGKAMQMVLTGDPIDATEADEIGLVEEVVDPEDLDEAVTDVVESIASNSPVALRHAKQSVQSSREMPLSAGLDHEFELFLGLFASEDSSEGIAAFIEDREPEWEGK